MSENNWLLKQFEDARTEVSSWSEYKQEAMKNAAKPDDDELTEGLINNDVVPTLKKSLNV